MRAPRTPRSVARVAFVALVLAGAVTALGPVSHPAPVSASTATYMEGLLVKWINNARENRGIPRLTVGDKLTDFAGYRAKTLASNNKLTHPSCLSCLLRQWSISFSTCSEVIAGTTYPWGYDAARSIYLAWKGSSGHWSTLMSRSFKRFGVGVAYRSSNRTTFAAAVLAG
jgi:uncharacterized protein YkwD